MPIILPPDDPDITRFAAAALTAGPTLTDRLARLRALALAEAGQLEGRARRYVLVAAGHAARLLLCQHGMNEQEADLQAGRMVVVLQAEFSQLVDQSASTA